MPSFVFLIMTCVAVIGNIVIAILAYGRHCEEGYYLARASIAGLLLNIGYFMASLSDNRVVCSLFFSLHYVALDFMLLCMLSSIFAYIGCEKRLWLKRTCVIFLVGCLVEVCIFIVNVFFPVSVDYLPTIEAVHPGFSTLIKPLFGVHVVLTITMAMAILFALVIYLLSIPWEYRGGFITVAAGIIVMSVLNAALAFYGGWEQQGPYSLHVSYVLGLGVLYWSMFAYDKSGMAKKLRMYSFNAIEQGVVLFDFRGRLVVKNTRALELIPWLKTMQDMTQEMFLEHLEREKPGNEAGGKQSFRCYIKTENGLRPMRCDYSTMHNEKGTLLGSLFVFSDERKATDLLTGFLRWKNFQRLCRTPSEHAFSVVSVCDINCLESINRKSGSEVGDRALQRLASDMRSVFPDGTMLVRGPEAALLAISQSMGVKDARGKMEQLREEYGHDIQFAVETILDNDVEKAAHSAIHAMQVHKMMDVSSHRSETLSSLVRALEQSDQDTKGHVLRTQKMGEELSNRFEMSDTDRAELSLLCILHDIGKIGVPLEILNKPGHLSEDEMQAIRTHVRKGYQIAISSPDTACIADAVLHHHERWDGKGYPDGIGGKAIPLLSRMISVVDAFDAMVSNRSYRPAMSLEEALQELEQNAGTQFDPVIAGEFIRMVRDDPQAYTREGESFRKEKTLPRDMEQDLLRSGSSWAVLCCRYWLDDNMNILSVDDGFEGMTGYCHEEVEGVLNQRDLLPDEDVADYLLGVNEQLARRPYAYMEHRLKKKDGSIIYVLCYGRDYYDSATKGFRSEILLADSASLYSIQLLCGNGVRRRMTDGEEVFPPAGDKVVFFMRCAEMLQHGGRLLLMSIGNTSLHSALTERASRVIYVTLQSSLRGTDLVMWDGSGIFHTAFVFQDGISVETMRERARAVFDRINLRLQVAGEPGGISMGAAVSVEDEEAEAVLNRSKLLLENNFQGGESRFYFQ